MVISTRMYRGFARTNRLTATPMYAAKPVLPARPVRVGDEDIVTEENDQWLVTGCVEIRSVAMVSPVLGHVADEKRFIAKFNRTLVVPMFRVGEDDLHCNHSEHILSIGARFQEERFLTSGLVTIIAIGSTPIAGTDTNIQNIRLSAWHATITKTLPFEEMLVGHKVVSICVLS